MNSRGHLAPFQSAIVNPPLHLLHHHRAQSDCQAQFSFISSLYCPDPKRSVHQPTALGPGFSETQVVTPDFGPQYN